MSRQAPGRPDDRHPGLRLLSALPDWLTGARLASIPLLWLVAYARRPVLLGVGVALAALTDVLDGPIARRTGYTSAFGSRFDSIADHLLSTSLLAWLLIFRPQFFREQGVLLLIWGVTGLGALLASWLRFRRFGDLHLYSAKVAGTLGYLFGIYLLISGTYSRPVFYVVYAAAMAGALETLAAVLMRRRVDEHMRTIFDSPREHDPP